jgi:hypothetical protein
MGVWGSGCWLKGSESVRICLFKRCHEQLLGGDISHSILGITLDQNWLIGSWFNPQGLYIETVHDFNESHSVDLVCSRAGSMLWFGSKICFWSKRNLFGVCL